jgi:tripartite-type tricarboxylate transporter receptor subunit TctC
LGVWNLNGTFYSLPYDVVNDFAPVSPLIIRPAILFTRQSMPARGLEELIARLQANPNKASAASVAASLHLVTAFVSERN